LIDDAGGHAGQQRQFVARVFAGQQSHAFEATDVAVDGLFGVPGAPGDVGGEQALQVQADDRGLVRGEAAMSAR
jgi:hypothetical protein